MAKPNEVVFELRVKRAGSPGEVGPALATIELRARDAGGQPVTGKLAGPETIQVEGEERALDGCLSWYLEEYLKFPFDQEILRVQKILRARDRWGRSAFDAVFVSPAGAALYALAQGRASSPLTLVIESNDPELLAWPWELMCSGTGERLASKWRVARQLALGEAAKTFDPLPIETSRLQVLLVTARPGGARDVSYRSISRPLVDLTRAPNSPVQVQLLRPPTFEALEEHLMRHRGRYHVLHFDGHGTYGQDSQPGSGPQTIPKHYLGTPQSRRGFLQFETDRPDPGEGLIRADRLGELLDRHRVPIVVLNACRSAMRDRLAADEFASVAGALVNGGVRSIVAMSHNLWVSGAQEFIPAFYKSLLTTGDVAEAVRAGRGQMMQSAGRLCAKGKLALEDWTVPVLFQQHAPTVVFTPRGQISPETPAPATVTQDQMPAEARISDAPFGFIGRDTPILELERALRGRAAVVVHGIGGVGKSTLVRGFLEWLADTGGLRVSPLWFGLDLISGVDYVLNRIGEAMGVRDIATLPLENARDGKPAHPKVELLGVIFAKLPVQLICVLDSFEVLTDAGQGEATGRFRDADRRAMRDLIRACHGTRFRIVVTSRSDEGWLGPEYRSLVDLPGLNREERWEFVDAVVASLRLKLDRGDHDLDKLLDALGGHPLLMRVVLPRLGREMTAARALEELSAGLPATIASSAGADQTLAKLGSTLWFATEGIPIDLRPALAAVALHERYVDSHLLGLMAGKVDSGWDVAKVEQLVDVLTHAGLVRKIQGAIEHGVLLELHPALSGHLRSAWLPQLEPAERERWVRAFVEVMGSVANQIAAKKVYEQEPFHAVHRANFRSALAEARRLGMALDAAALSWSLAAYAQNTLDFDAAERLYTELAEARRAAGDERSVAGAYHCLGMVAQERRDFKSAEGWYKRSLETNERLDNERDAASTYHQLGIVTQLRRNFAAAEGWYKKSLEIKERFGDELGAAGTYHQLGTVALERRDFEAAEGWCKKALEIEERLGDEHGAAGTYHQLGTVALERRDFEAAEGWYKKALEIKERLGDELGAALTYHQLGRVAEERREFESAEGWYKRSLEIKERLGDEHSSASTHYQLGIVAQERRDFEAAEKWYKKSLEIDERLGDEHGAAIDYSQLGRLARARSYFFDAVQFGLRAAEGFSATNAPHLAKQAILGVARSILAAPASDRPSVMKLATDLGLPRETLEQAMRAAEDGNLPPSDP